MAIRDTVMRVFTPQSTKVWHKLALVAATLVLPVTALNWLLLSTYQGQIGFARAELGGVDALQPVRKLAEHTVQHNALAAAAIAGDPAAKRDLQAKSAEIDGDLKAVGDLDPALGVKDQVASIRDSWTELKRKGLNLTPADSLEQHNQLIKSVLGLFTTIGGSSNLAYDPVSVSSLLQDTMSSQVPAESAVLGQIRAIAVPSAIAKQTSPADKAQLLSLLGQAKPYRDAIETNLNTILRTAPALESSLKPAVADHLAATDEFLNLVNTGVAGDGVTASPQDVSDFGQRAVTSAFRLFDDSTPNLKGLIQSRIDQARTSVIVGVLLSVAGLLLTLLIGARITRGITEQVQSITDMFGQIGIGNYQARADVTSTDELGEMAGSLNTMLDNTLVLVQSRGERDAIQQAIVKLLDEVGGVAEGDLTREAEVTEDVTGAIADAFNYMIHQLRRIISDVQDATMQVGESALGIRGNSERLVQGAENQAEQILATSAAIEEIALSIQKVSENAADSANVAQQALANATQGNEAVQNTIQGMNRIRDQAQETAKRIKRLGESSQEIGQIIQLIDDIADRTSILALNASIQAAAAGEAGRGFAVVAEEVERLAERSTDATKKIATLIKTIQSETNEAVGSMEKSIAEVVEGSKLANQAGQALDEIGSVSRRLAELIQSISETSKQQAQGSEAIARSMGNISQITQQTAEGTRDAAESVSDLAAMAEALRNSVSTFRLPGREWEATEVQPVPAFTSNGHSEPYGEVDRVGGRSGEFRRKPVHV